MWHLQFLRSGSIKGGIKHLISVQTLACPFCNRQTPSRLIYTHFGFSQIPVEEKATKVGAVFSSVAKKYDVMNDVMSLGIHRVWKDILVHRLSPTHKMRVIDMAGGTGDVAFRIVSRQRSDARRAGNLATGVDKSLSAESRDQSDDGDDGQLYQSYPRVMVCDINADMLEEGKRRASHLGLSSSSSSPSTSSSSPSTADVGWLQADAQNLPIHDTAFDAYTIAFGIRNVTHIDQALREAYRVLKPGGRFLCLEFSRVNNSALRWLYDQYSFQLIPPLGVLISSDWSSYQYLVESIRQFPCQEDFAAMIRNAGFRCVSYDNLTAGIVAIHSAFKL